MKRGILNLVVAGFVAAGSVGSAAAETVTIGLLGSYSATTWPVLIASKKGFFAEQKIEPDVVFAPSAPSLTQQLITGSIHIIGASGCAEPLLAAEQKAPVAILRIVGAKPNMELVTKADIKSIADLKGRKISVAQLSGITGILFEAMIAPQGLTVKDFEIFQANSSGQRLAALKSGAVDATILVPPQNFIAEQQGFKRLAKLITYAPDVPQTCMIVNSDWAKAHPNLVKGMVTAVNKATDWLYDAKNRDEAVKTIVATAKGDPKLIEKSLDFLVEIGYFAKTDAVSRKAFANYMSKLRASNYLKSDLKLEQAVYPTVKLVD
jgi:ABC-type nitrate/sulfonate/bicarbonate transport system substrate-binding protein